MAINLVTQYPGKVDAASPAFPFGKARNVTTPGDGTGTPWEQAIVNDLVGWQQSLLSRVGATPTGTPDQVGASQYLDAIEEVSRLAAIPDISQAYTVKTVALMKALTGMPVGKKIFWQGYYAESDGGSNWGIVKSGAHTDDGGEFFTLADGKYVQANLKGAAVNVSKFGAIDSGDSIDALDAAYASSANSINFGGVMYGITRELAITKNTDGGGGGVKMIDLITTHDNTAVIYTDDITVKNFTGDGQATITSGVPNIDPTPWNSGNFNSFFGGRKGLSIISADNVTLENCRGINSAAGAGIRLAGADFARLVRCSTSRTRGTFGDGFYIASCKDTTITDCSAEDFTRIGFVTEDDSSNHKYKSCHAKNGHDASRYYGGGEFNAGFWAESSTATSYVTCTSDNTAGSVEYIGFVGAGNKVIDADSPNSIIYLGCLSYNANQGFKLTSFSVNTMAVITATDCKAYAGNITGSRGFTIELGWGGAKSAVTLTNCYSEAAGVESNSTPYFITGSDVSEVGGLPVVKLINCKSNLKSHVGFLDQNKQGGDVILPINTGGVDLIIDGLQTVAEGSVPVTLHLDDDQAKLTIKNSKVTHTAWTQLVCTDLILENVEAEISFNPSCNSISATNIKIIPDTVEVIGDGISRWNTSGLLSGDITLTETKFKHTITASKRGIASNINFTVEYDLVGNGDSPVEYNYGQTPKPIAILSGTFLNTGVAAPTNYFVIGSTDTVLQALGLVVDDTVTSTANIGGQVPGAIAGETKVTF